jgi:hypothetical protein
VIGAANLTALAHGLRQSRSNNRGRTAVTGAGGYPAWRCQPHWKSLDKPPLKPITETAGDVGIPPRLTEQHGEHVAKIGLQAIDELADRPKAKYIVVTRHRYPSPATLKEKVETLATRIYGADGVDYSPLASRRACPLDSVSFPSVAAQPLFRSPTVCAEMSGSDGR